MSLTASSMKKLNQLAHTIRREYKEFCGEEIKSNSMIGSLYGAWHRYD